MKSYWQYLKHLALYLTQKTLTARHNLNKLITPQLNKLKIEKPYRVDIGRPDRIVILLAGCGGTGGWTAHILAQLAVWAHSAGLDLRLYFVDNDVVEEKNLTRQNFCSAEIGQPKAFTLAWRYTAALGIPITPLVEPFSDELLDRIRPAYSPQGTLTLLIGAVDNVCARRQMAEAVTERLKQPGRRRALWWIDAGNERLHGQVAAGNSLEPEPLLSPLGYCTALPLPHLQEPGLLVERDPPPVDLSCADLTLLAEQSAMINRMMATTVGLYLYRLLQSRDLTLMRSYLSLESGGMRSIPIDHGRLVKPEPPRRIPVVAPAPPEDNLLTCPVCGGQLIEGEDHWDGVLITVRFCEQCTYREEACPDCGSAIEESETTLDGQSTAVLRCLDCPWHEPLPALETA